MQQKSGNTPPKKPGRASLPPLLTTPPKGHPFAGATGLNAPARNTKLPDLTAHVAEAKARKSALTSGGLVPEAQRKAASAAGKTLAAHKAAKQAAAKTTPKTRTPAGPEARTGVQRNSAKSRGAADAPPKTLPVTPTTLPAWLTKPVALPGRQSVPALGSSPSPPESRDAAPAWAKPFTYQGKTYRLNAPGGDDWIPVSTTPVPLKQDPTKVGFFMSQEPKGTYGASRASLTGALTGTAGALGDAASAAKSGIQALPGDAKNALRNDLGSLGTGGELASIILNRNSLAKGGDALAAKVSQAGEKAGQINVDLLPAAQAAQFPGQKFVTEQQIRQLEAQKGKLGTFPQALRHTLIEASVKNGWPREDVTNAVDADLLHYWSNKPATPIIQFAKNAGGFAARQASTPAGFVALGDAGYQAARGNTKLAKQEAQTAADGMRTGVPFLSQHGVLHDWYWHPGESIQNLSLAVGGADTLLGKASHFPAGIAREVTPEGFAKPVSRGTLSEKPLERGITNLRDAYVNSRNPILNAAVTNKRGEVNPLLGPISPVARRTAIAKADYLQTRNRAVAPTMAKSNQLRANVAVAAKDVGKERAAALLAHLQGLDPPARSAFYRQVADELGPIKGRGARAHAKLSADNHVTERTLTPKDQKFVTAVREAATFSTQTREAAGQLNADLSGRYRAYQLPIVAAAKSGDELGVRTQFLHDEWTKALAQKRAPEELGTIADQFTSALDDFTQRHADQGGTTPVYIPQEVPQTLASPYRREASVTATGKVPKLKATQDKLISSGQYRSTPQGVSLETHRAAVVQARIDHFNAVNEEYATKAENGGPADPNVVYVKAENLRSPVKLENTVGEHNLTDEDVHSTLDQMRQMLESGRVDVTGGYIPAHGDIRAIPKTIYDELHSSTQLPKGAPIGETYDALNRKYQRVMLSKPSTAAANIVGNPILAMMGGASPWEATVGGYKALERPEHIPPQLMDEGLAASAGQKAARTPIGKYVNYSLSHQRASEDAARAALYHHVVGPYVRKSMEETGASADQILKDLASGKDPHVHAFVKQVEDFLGSMRASAKIHPGTERMLSRSILFHRWLGHILTLTLYTMPVKYPGRAVLLQRIAEIGDDYRKHHGVYPDWYAGMIPLMQIIAKRSDIPGADAFTRVLPTGSIWPTSNLQLPLADSSGPSPYGAAISSLNPVVRAVAEAPTGMDFTSITPYKDSQGNQIGPGLGPQNLKLLAGQLYRAAPYASVVTPMPGRSPDSFPGNMHNAVHKNRYGRPLPDGFGTTAIPYGGNTPSLSLGYLAGLASRLAVGGSGLQDLPTNTRGTQYAQTASLIKARQARNKMIRDDAKARAKKP